MRHFTLETFVWIGIASFLIMMLVAATDFEFGFDQAIFFLGGHALVDHQTIYTEIFEFKPPPVFFIYAGAIQLFGDNEYAPRILESLFMLLTAGAFAAVARHIADWRMGISAFAVYYLMIFGSGYWNTAQVETLIAPFFGFGTLCLVLGLKSGRAFGIALVGCAALLTFPALMKPTMGGFLPAAFGAAVVYHEAWHKPRLLMGLTASFLTGVLLCMGIVLGGAEMFGATSQYLAMMSQALGLYLKDAGGFTASLTLALNHAVHSFLPLTLGLLLPFVFLRTDRLRLTIAFFLLASCAIQLLGVLLQGRNFLYHYGATVLPAACLTGWGIWLLLEKARTSRWPVLATGSLLATMLLLFGPQIRSTIYSVGARAERLLTGGEDPIWGSIRWTVSPWQAQVDGFVDQLGIDDEPVLLWAHKAPFLYFHGRKSFYPATRILASTYLRIMPDGTVFHEMMMDDLAQSKPRVIIVERDDADLALGTGMVTSDVHVREQFAALRALIEANYAATDDIAGYAVYLKKNSADAPPG